MFKILQARKGIFSLARVPLKLNAQNLQEPIRIQHVRIRSRNLPSFKRFAVNTLGIVASFYIFQAVFVNQLAKIELPPLSEAEKEEMKEQGPLFIPFLGTTQQVAAKPYKSTDPEWQAFVKFAQDPELGKRVRQDLANMIKSSCEKHPVLVLKCGKEMKVRRQWLDIDFPMRPPPEFERSGYVLQKHDDRATLTTL